MDKYEQAVIDSIAAYVGELKGHEYPDGWNLVRKSVNDYLARQKHDEYFGSQKKEIAEIEPIWIATGLPLGATRADYLFAEKLNKVISVINQMRRNEK